MEKSETDQIAIKRRSRRSNRFILHLEGDEEICGLIEKDLPNEERFKDLMKRCIKHSLDSTLSDETGSAFVLDIYSVIDSMMPTIDEMHSKGVFTEAVKLTNKKQKDCVVDEELERRINNGERYIKRLKKEIKEWDRLLDQHQNELENAKSKLENPIYQEESIKLVRKPINQTVNYEERFKQLNMTRESLNRQVEIFNDFGNRIEDYRKNAERQISEFGKKIKLPFDENQNLIDQLFKI